MTFSFSNISTWLIIELVATSILVVLNMLIPSLMAFSSYRNMVNFYFSSAALSSSLLNCLYIYYLVQTLRSRGLSENNCRAIYYLQTSCTVVLAYTITAMHANFVLCLLSSSSSLSSGSSDSHHHHHHSNRSCLQSCGLCLRKFFRRFCFCTVLCIWSLSFTATIPLLYTIDSNEKNPKPVYCPGTTQISYLEEWFDRNRLIQSVIFNLTPLLITFALSIIALLKLLYDALVYFFYRLKNSKYASCRRKTTNRTHQREGQNSQLPRSFSMLSSLGILNNSPISSGLSLSPITESSTPTSERTISSAPTHLQTCGNWCSTSFLRFLLVLSCCLLACIYPIAMRFYMVYFSVLVPLIFAVLNYSLGQLSPSTNQVPMMEISNQDQLPATTNFQINPVTVSSSYDRTESANQRTTSRQSAFKPPYSDEQYEMQTPLMTSLAPNADVFDEHEELVLSPSVSSQSSMLPTGSNQYHQTLKPPISAKQKYFSNTLYENYNRHNFLR